MIVWLKYNDDNAIVGPIKLKLLDNIKGFNIIISKIYFINITKQNIMDKWNINNINNIIVFLFDESLFFDTNIDVILLEINELINIPKITIINEIKN